MSNQKTILPLGSAAQADNWDHHRLDYIRPDQQDMLIRGRMSAREMIAAGIVGGGMASGLALLLWIVKVWNCWAQTWDVTTECRIASGLGWFYIIALVIVAVGAVVIFLFGSIVRMRAEYLRVTITRDRYSNPVSALVIHQQGQRAAAGYFLAAQKAEIAMAPHKQYPAGLDALSINNAAAPALLAPVSEDGGPLIIDDRDWLDWIDETPHLMIAGATNAGKTTLAEALLAQRAARGELLYILDPHYQPGKWCGLPATGGGRGFGTVLTALGYVLEEMDRRYKDFDQGKKASDFDRLTVLVDEVPGIVEYCYDGKSLVDRRWHSFAKQLGSEARKVGISVILLTQSPNVEDILLNGRMRKNFTRIALGDEIPALLAEEKEPKRRRALSDLLRGRQFAAAMEYRGEVHVLNTDRVPAMATRPVAHLAQPWQPPTRVAVSASEQTHSAVHVSIAVPSPQTDRQTGKLSATRKQALIKAIRDSGKTRHEARIELASMGEGLDNDDWATAA